MTEIRTDAAPTSSSPLSQGIIADDMVFVSGQVPVDPETGEIVAADIETQTRQTLENVAAVLEAADMSISDVVKMTVFVTDMDEFEGMNAVYEEFMPKPYPARSAIEVSGLAIDVGVEIEAIATR